MPHLSWVAAPGFWCFSGALLSISAVTTAHRTSPESWRAPKAVRSTCPRRPDPNTNYAHLKSLSAPCACCHGKGVVLSMCVVLLAGQLNAPPNPSPHVWHGYEAVVAAHLKGSSLFFLIYLGDIVVMGASSSRKLSGEHRQAMDAFSQAQMTEMKHHFISVCGTKDAVIKASHLPVLLQPAAVLNPAFLALAYSLERTGRIFSTFMMFSRCWEWRMLPTWSSQR